MSCIQNFTTFVPLLKITFYTLYIKVTPYTLNLKTIRHIILASFATATTTLLITVLFAAACVSCGGVGGADDESGAGGAGGDVRTAGDGARATGGMRSGTVEPHSAAASPDTLALVEGLRLFDSMEYDLAREQLTVSARSASTYIRAESFLYLNALEMELGNYRAARTHLDRYHAETMRLLRSAAEVQSRAERQTAHLVGRYEALVWWIVLIMTVLASATLFLLRRRGTARLVRGARGEPSPQAYPAWPTSSTSPTSPTSPEGARGAAVFAARSMPASSVTPAGFVASAELPELAGPTSAERAAWLAEAEAFRQTAMWAEIAPLAAAKPGRDARVLTTARQDVLDADLAATFPVFAAHLRAACPPLTAGDVKLCCLSLAGLGAFGRAVCFGSTETNIIKQRKHTIKKKLSTDAGSRALFEFVFNTNKL